jgi:ribosomal protein S18 acetylase RimI-like enzyme
MSDCLHSIEIRPFNPSDAEACLNMRGEAFTRVFSEGLKPEMVSAGANAYDDSDFTRMAETMPSFVAWKGNYPVGFYTVRLLDRSTAEILFLYVNLDHFKQGIGCHLLQHMEKWLAERYPEVSNIVLNTAIPLYNQKFYEKFGYSVIGRSVCTYHYAEIPAVRLAKKLHAKERGGGETA